MTTMKMTKLPATEKLTNKTVAAVTGASSGIGLATAELLVRQGCTVYCLSRSAPLQCGIIHIATDVSDEASVAAAFGRITAEQGRLDLLVNNAGFGISGATELTSLSDAKRLFDVNFFGAFVCTKYAAPLLRAAGGRIINVSSAAAVFSIPYQAFYSASKAAANSLTLALRNELKPFGITVCAVMPGDVRTGFTAARSKNSGGDGLYGNSIDASVAVMEKDEINGMPPSAVAHRICVLAHRRAPKALTVVGAKYRFVCVLSKLLPSSFVNAVVGKMYIKSGAASNHA